LGITIKTIIEIVRYDHEKSLDAIYSFVIQSMESEMIDKMKEVNFVHHRLTKKEVNIDKRSLELSYL